MRLELHTPGRDGESAKTIHLTLMEADLLRYLLDHPGRTIARKELLENVWHVQEDTDTRPIDNFIVRLRRYLEPDPAKARASHHGARHRLPLRARTVAAHIASFASFPAPFAFAFASLVPRNFIAHAKYLCRDLQTDPVCGMKVDPSRAAATVEHEGQTYYFCGKGCAAKFQSPTPASTLPRVPPRRTSPQAPPAAGTQYTCPMHPADRPRCAR
jgi:YHS domain-containing protein